MGPLFQPFEYKPYVEQNPELPLDRMMQVGTMMQGRYDQSQAAIRKTQDYLDMIEVAPGDYDLKQQKAQKLQEDMDALMDEYDGRLETASFQQALSRKITEVASDPEIIGMQDMRRNYLQWEAIVQEYEKEGKRYWDRKPYYDKQGNPFTTVGPDGKVRTFRPEVEALHDWGEKSVELMSEIEEDITTIEPVELDDFIKYGKVSQISNAKIAAQLNNAFTVFKNSEAGSQMIDYYESQFKENKASLTVGKQTHGSYRELAEAHARALLLSAGELQTYTRTHETYLNKPKRTAGITSGRGKTANVPEPPSPSSMLTLTSTQGVLSEVSSPDIVENRKLAFETAMNEAKSQLFDDAAGHIKDVNDIEIVDNDDGTFTINYPSNFDRGSVADFETKEMAVKNQLKRQKLLKQDAQRTERDSMKKSGINVAHFPNIYAYEDALYGNIMASDDRQRRYSMAVGTEAALRKTYMTAIESSIENAFGIGEKMMELDYDNMLELRNDMNAYEDLVMGYTYGANELDVVEEAEGKIRAHIETLPHHEKRELLQQFNENVDKVNAALGGFGINVVTDILPDEGEIDENIFSMITQIQNKPGFRTLGINYGVSPKSYRRSMKALLDAGAITKEQYNEGLNNMHDLFKDMDNIHDYTTRTDEDGKPVQMTKVDAYLQELDSLDDPRLRPYNVVGPGFIDDDNWETAKEKADNAALAVLGFPDNGPVGFDVETGKMITKDNINVGVMELHKNGQFGEVKSYFELQGFGEAPEDWILEEGGEENTRLKGAGIVLSYPKKDGGIGYMFMPESNANVRELFQGTNDLELSYLSVSSQIDDAMNESDANVAVLSPTGSKVEYVIEKLTHPTQINGLTFGADDYRVSYTDENGRQVTEGYGDKYEMIQNYWGLMFKEQAQKGLEFNIGNIRGADGKFKAADTLTQGVDWLMNDIDTKIQRTTGNAITRNYGKGRKYNPDTGEYEDDQDLILGQGSTLLDFFEVYANYTDNNDSLAYANYVLSQLVKGNPDLQGKRPWEVPLSSLNTALAKKQMAIAMMTIEKGEDFEYLDEAVQIINNAY